MNKQIDKLLISLLQAAWPVIGPALTRLLVLFGIQLRLPGLGTILVGGDQESAPKAETGRPRRTPRMQGGGGAQAGTDDASHPVADPSAAPRFHVRFEGEACRGNALVRGRSARLVFGEGKVTSLQAVVFWGRRFAILLGAQPAKLTITVTTEGGIEVDGADVGVARFNEGRLVEEVGFPLRVLDTGSIEASITVEFFSGGLRLYGFTIAKALVAAGEESAAAAATPAVDEIDLDIADATRANDASGKGRDELLLKLTLVTGGLLLSLNHRTPDGITAYDRSGLVADLDAIKLDALRSRLNKEIGEQFYASDIWDKVDPSTPTEAQVGHLAECFERVASAGYLLFEALYRGEDAKAILTYLMQQPPGARLTISTPSVFLPFEIMYPHSFTIDWPQDKRRKEGVRHRDFLGARFALEMLRSGDGNYAMLLDRHRKAPRHVSLNLNGSITSRTLPDPKRVHQDLVDKLVEHKVACTPATTCDAKKQVLLGAESPASLIYVYCHGAAATAAAGSIEELHLDNECIIRPGASYPGARFETAPIVILNACYGSSASPLFFTGFLDSFRKLDALGLVAASFPVPIQFGAAFGSELVMECLFGSGPLGDRLRLLRLRHAEHGNPVPLFYSVQCQLA